MSVKTKLARAVMGLARAEPSADDLSLWEVFKHPRYTQASDAERAKLELASSEYTNQLEKDRGFFDQYFPDVAKEDLSRISLLDLGCFTGGRLVAWQEKYRFAKATGIDINPIFARAGRRLAEKRGVHIQFDVGVGEDLPYDDESFDLIVAFDVFEHVQNLEVVLKSCMRTLRPGGRLLTVFPPYYQPLEAHLGMFTNVPALQWAFSGKTIARCLYDISIERGESHAWYARRQPELEEWEKSPYLNGTTVSTFRRIVNSQKWKVEDWIERPLLSDGRRAQKRAFRILRNAFRVAMKLGRLDELFLGRVCAVLRKPDACERTLR